jgi:hypothetical protein
MLSKNGYGSFLRHHELTNFTIGSFLDLFSFTFTHDYASHVFRLSDHTSAFCFLLSNHL